LVVCAQDIGGLIGGEFDFAEVVTVSRQTGKSFVAIGGLFQRFFTDLELHK